MVFLPAIRARTHDNHLDENGSIGQQKMGCLLEWAKFRCNFIYKEFVIIECNFNQGNPTNSDGHQCRKRGCRVDSAVIGGKDGVADVPGYCLVLRSKESKPVYCTLRSKEGKHADVENKTESQLVEESEQKKGHPFVYPLFAFGAMEIFKLFRAGMALPEWVLELISSESSKQIGSGVVPYLQDIFSGLMNPFKEGDLIELDDKELFVLKKGPDVSRLMCQGGRTRTVRNSALMAQSISKLNPDVKVIRWIVTYDLNRLENEILFEEEIENTLMAMGVTQLSIFQGGHQSDDLSANSITGKLLILYTIEFKKQHEVEKLCRKFSHATLRIAAEIGFKKINIVRVFKKTWD